MKYLFLFFALLSLALCDAPPKSKLIAVEDAFVNVKNRPRLQINLHIYSFFNVYPCLFHFIFFRK